MNVPEAVQPLAGPALAETRRLGEQDIPRSFGDKATMIHQSSKVLAT